MSKDKWTDKAKEELAKGDSSLADIARKAVKAGGAGGAVQAAMQMMGFGGGGSDPVQDVKKNTGIDMGSSGEGDIIKTFIRHLGMKRDAQNQVYLPDSGATYATLVKGVANLLYPEDEAKREDATTRIRGVFKGLVEGPESFDAAYGDFSGKAMDGKPGWQAPRALAYERFVPFAAEMRAMKQCCEDAVAAGHLTTRDQLFISVNAWDRDATKLAEALRINGKTTKHDEIPFPAETVIAGVVAEATPFAERKKPGIEQVVKGVIAEKEAPKGQDLSELKELLDVKGHFAKKKDIEGFLKVLGSESIFSGAQQRSFSAELVKQVAAVRTEVDKVEGGKAANTGALVTALEVLEKITTRLYDKYRDGMEASPSLSWPKTEALPREDNTNFDPVNAGIMLEDLNAGLAAQKKALASARGVAE